MRKEKRNDVVRRYDGDIYIVTGISETDITLMPAEESDGEYCEADGQEAITVPAKTFAEFFTVILEAEPEVPDVQDYTVEDGVLFENGEPVDTGSVQIMDVKAACRGNLLITAVPYKREGKQELFSLNTETGYLNSLGVIGDRIDVIHQYDDGFVIVVQDREKVRYADGDEYREGETLRRSCGLIALVGGRLHLCKLVPGNTPDIGEHKVYTKDSGFMIVFTSSTAFRAVETENGDLVDIVLPERGRNNAAVIRFSYEDGFSYNYVPSFDGDVQDVLPCTDGRNAVFVTDRGIIHSNTGHFYRQAVGKKVLKAVAKHPLPLDMRVEGERKTVFVFGNPATYGTAVITVEKSATDDSGFHTTVEIN